MPLINSPDNGATEIPGTSNADSIFVFLAGPIRHWWKNGQWDSLEHRTYTDMRSAVHKVLSDEFLVYAPHRAWRGPWNIVAQQINDHAVSLCDTLVAIKIPEVEATGTDEEIALAQELGIPIFILNMDANWHVNLDKMIPQIKGLKHSGATT